MANMKQVDKRLESNLAEFMLTAARVCPNDVCVETETASYTFKQMVGMTESIRSALCAAIRVWETSGGSKPASQRACAVPEFFEKRPDEHIITIVLDRGAVCLAAMHAAMLERCAYNTFDTMEPRDKLLSWIEVAQPPVILCSKAVMFRLGWFEDCWLSGKSPSIVLDAEKVADRGQVSCRAQPPDIVASKGERLGDLDRLCYVIFTSGSTGKPKAVMIQNQSACNVVRVWSDFVGLRKEDRMAQMASMAFDVHVLEVYGALYAKCPMVVCPNMTKRSGPDLLKWMTAKNISCASVVPSLLRSIGGSGGHGSCLPDLRLLDVGGEALGRDVLEDWAPGRQLFNTYGPTECSVVCTGCEVKVGDSVTIGWDLPSYRNLVLDQDTHQPVPDGQRGVLFTFGIGLARGYLDDEAKTLAKFLHLQQGRAYNTGDVVSVDEMGRFNYHGRADWQVKVRGIRIELEALEEAISNVPGVAHCEARLVDGTKLALIVSGTDLQEALLKETAAKLGKGYQLDLVKLCENTCWKFNTSGKLVRNHVQLTPLASGVQDGSLANAKQDGSATYDRSKSSDRLELDIASCLAPLVTARDSWDHNSHFIDDLGIDSTGFGKLIMSMRKNAALSMVDLATLFRNPSVRELASYVKQKGMEKDSEEQELKTHYTLSLRSKLPRGSETDIADLFLTRVQGQPHAIVTEAFGASSTYMQTFHKAAGIQDVLRKSLKATSRSHARGASKRMTTVRAEPPCASSGIVSCMSPLLADSEDAPASEEGVIHGETESVVVVILPPCPDALSSMVAVWMERHTVCIIPPRLPREQIAACLEQVQPAAIITNNTVACSLELSDLIADLPDLCVILDVTTAPAVASHTISALRPFPELGAELCAITLDLANGSAVDPKLTLLGHGDVLELISTETQRLKLGPGARRIGEGKLLDLACVLAGGTVVYLPALNQHGSSSDAPSLSSLLCGFPCSANYSQVEFVPAQQSCIVGLNGKSSEMILDTSEGPRDMLLPSRTPIEINHDLCAVGSFFLVESHEQPEASESALPWLCFFVQTFAMMLAPLYRAAYLIVFIDLIMPKIEHLPLPKMLVTLMAVALAQEVAFLWFLILWKWCVIGRYKEGKHCLYSWYYLQHWLVNFVAEKSLVCNLSAASSPLPPGFCIDGQSFLRNVMLNALGADVSLSAIVTVGVVGFDCVRIGPMASVHGPRHLSAVTFSRNLMSVGHLDIGAGACVHPAAVIPPGTRMLPGSQVEPLSAVRVNSLVSGVWSGVPAKQIEKGDSNRIPTISDSNWFSVQMAMASIFAFAWQLAVEATTIMLIILIFKYADDTPAIFALMIALLDFFGIAGYLVFSIAVCRLLPATRVPMDLPLHSWRAQLALLKLRLASACSKMLGDASVQAAFVRACGAEVGAGCHMAEQVLLPDTLSVGDNCFFASSNVLTSLIVDQGRVQIKTRTEFGSDVFVGNGNIIRAGLPSNSLAGLRTFIAELPEGAGAFFGNPPMRFARPTAKYDEEIASTGAQACWQQFSTSILDVFLWKMLKSMELPVWYLTCEYILQDGGLDYLWSIPCRVPCRLLLFLITEMLVWWLMNQVATSLYHDELPLSNHLYSRVVTGWYRALSIRRDFPCPFSVQGTSWYAHYLRLLGAHVGKGFFCPTHECTDDPAFARFGDNVTMDYDASMRQHTFEDSTLKWGPREVGNGTTLMQGSLLATSSTGEDVVLGLGSVTWKGLVLESRQHYEGAPAKAVDMVRLP
eukprot:TRINITY_DN23529_c0_g2_i1.p1 TRINITY_DN23529_c0_g2~~TRINITY_DN23529_c0_g2_i1.p1  ORF type:complete len:1742 (+),score=248.69 TRINITY_DN23529_c0_g2_i1:62-5287(+)